MADQKFYLVHSYARHGTHLTRTLLAQHPEVTCYSELFQGVLRGKPIGPLHPEWNALSVKNWFKTFMSHQHPTEIVGSVMHSDNVTHSRRPTRARRIGQRVGKLKWPVIQVLRKNMLATFASHRIAHFTQHWGWLSAGGPTKMRLKFRKSDWETHLTRTRTRFKRACRLMYTGQPVIRFWYEDIVADPEAASRMMFEFLGVEPMGFMPTTQKQERRPLEAIFSNWPLVEKTLKGTMWAGCLHDNPPAWTT